MPSRVVSIDSDIFFDENEEKNETIPMDPSVSLKPNMSPKISKAYSRYCRANVNLFAVIPTFVLATIIIICRLNLGNPQKEPFFYVCDAFLMISVALFFINLSPIILGRILKYPNSANKIENFITRLPFKLEDVMMFFATCIYGFNLVARVVAGPCPDEVTLWETQTCTPKDGDVPIELVIILYIMPLVFITTIENVSVAALIFSWFIIIGFVTFGIAYNNAWSQLWVLFNSLFLVILTFTVERDKRIAFLRLMELKEQKMKALTHLRNQHAAETALAEVAAVTATNERNLRVCETQQLRSLMGNVAHDLKTPLFSVEADIELLKLLFKAIPPQAVQMALASMPQKCRVQNIDFDPANIFDSLWSTCRFMIAAINRGQDFAKSSMNIALVPSQGNST